MCHFGDIKVVPDSGDDFFVTGSSYPICPFSKMVISLSLAYSSAELQSVVH